MQIKRLSLSGLVHFEYHRMPRFPAKSLARPLIGVCNNLYAPALRPLRDIAQRGALQVAFSESPSLMHSKRPHDSPGAVKEKAGVSVQPRVAAVAPHRMTQASVVFCSLCRCCASENAEAVSMPCGAGRSHLHPPAPYLPHRGRLCQSPGGAFCCV